MYNLVMTVTFNVKPYVGISFSVVDKRILSNAFPFRNSVISAGVEVDQVQHVVDGLDDPQDVRLLQDGVQTIGELPISPDFGKSWQAKIGCVKAKHEVKLKILVIDMSYKN